MNLIHVSNLEHIESIIENGLKFSISKEDFIYVDSKDNIQWEKTFYIPMISFFGMPISEHLRINQSYGDLGIILKDYFIYNDKLNPIRYYNIFSHIVKTQVEIPNQVIPAFHSTLKGASTVGYNSNVANMWRDNLIFSKPYSAHLYRRCKKCDTYFKNLHFYNFGLEREWRIIPSGFNSIDFGKTNTFAEISSCYTSELYLPIRNHILGFIVKSQSRKKYLKNWLKKYKLSHLRIYIRKNYGWSPRVNLKCGCSNLPSLNP